MLFSPVSENLANIIEDSAKRQAKCGVQGDLSRLWSGCDLSQPSRVELPRLRNCGVKPPETKALTGQRTPNLVLFNHPGKFFEVLYEATMFKTPRFIIGGTEN
jgi:hypothetical protein